MGTLLGLIFMWAAEEKQTRMSQYWNIGRGTVAAVFRKCRDLCSQELIRRPIIPFGGPAEIVQIDESKFNRKPKVRILRFAHCPQKVRGGY